MLVQRPARLTEYLINDLMHNIYQFALASGDAVEP